MLGIDNKAVDMLVVIEGANDGVWCVGVCPDVGDTADEGLDRADGEVNGLVMDDILATTILLVVNGEGGSGTLLEEDMLGEPLVKDVGASPEGHILESELDCAATLLLAMVGVLPHSEEVVKCYID